MYLQKFEYELSNTNIRFDRKLNYFFLIDYLFNLLFILYIFIYVLSNSVNKLLC